MFTKSNAPMVVIFRWTILVSCLGALGNAALADALRKFDEFGNIQCSDELARLDNYGISLRKAPDTIAVVVAYGGQFDTRHGEVVARLFAIRDRLVSHHSIDASRIVILNGGFRKRFQIELWIIHSLGRDSAKELIYSEVSPTNAHLKSPVLRKWEYRCARKAN